MIKLNKAPFFIKKMDKIYEFYDEPIVYTFIDNAGRLYLTSWVDWDEGKYTWLIKQINFQVAKNLELKFTTLRNVFLDENIPTVYILEEYNNGNKDYYLSYVDELKEELLPDQESYIEFTNEDKLGAIELIGNALKHSNRYVVDLSLEPKNSHLNEIRATVLGEALINFQDLVQIVALGPTATIRSRVPDEIKKDSEMLVTETFAASFGVRLESNKLVTLLHEDSIKSTLKKTLELLSAANDLETQQDILAANNLKSLNSLMALLKTLSENEVGVNVKTAFPTATEEVVTQEVHLTSEESLSLLNNMENTTEVRSSTVDLLGTLYSFDSRSKAFKFISEEGKPYKGYISEENENISFKIPSNGEIKLSVSETDFIYTGNIKYEYQLLSWEGKDH